MSIALDTTVVVNRALQSFGSRTTVTQAEIDTGGSNEAIQANLIFDELRDVLCRMAPWNCTTKFDNLTYITSSPGTPENSFVPANGLWERGFPAPPWAYEYQYPTDCLRALFVIPQQSLALIGGVPIYPSNVNSGWSNFWASPPIRFKVSTDSFLQVTAVNVVSGGQNYQSGEDIFLQNGPSNAFPMGAPPVVQVVTVNSVTGAVLTANFLNRFPYAVPPIGGSLFGIPGVLAQASSTLSGTGATFSVTIPNFTLRDQRVILTNQQNAILAYSKQALDPNLWDPAFLDAFVNLLGARLCFALTGDKASANMKMNEANQAITLARGMDGNESLTINDVTPDWIRARGILDYSQATGSTAFDWGPLFPLY